MEKTPFILTTVITCISIVTCFHAKEGKASAPSGPICTVIAKVVNNSSEKRQLDTGREYEAHYIYLKVIKVLGGNFCPVEEGQTYQVIDNYPGSFEIGQKIKAGIESGSAMSPNGGVNFLQWSSVRNEDGSSIRSKGDANLIIDFLQGEDKPIVVKKDK